eukprot:TRINITY_DN15025_c0_g1_i1.p1 TRINITY_DN15025_c0_g1~~TRINITY_DN15025_c0_g1_i1.p1  ORF type:complete len:752 (+),score=141.00 TRINITY_DN15025_c0_g1_i1:299-2554(+)
MTDVESDHLAIGGDDGGVEEEAVGQASAAPPPRRPNRKSSKATPVNGAPGTHLPDHAGEGRATPSLDLTVKRGNNVVSDSGGMKGGYKGTREGFAGKGSSLQEKEASGSTKEKMSGLKKKKKKLGGKLQNPVEGNKVVAGTAKGEKEERGVTGAASGGNGFSAKAPTFSQKAARPGLLASAFEALQRSPMPRGKVTARTQEGSANSGAVAASSAAIDRKATPPPPPPAALEGRQRVEARVEPRGEVAAQLPAKRAATSDAARSSKLQGHPPDYVAVVEKRKRQAKSPSTPKLLKKKSPKPTAMGASMSVNTGDELPDHLRCRRNDGKDWRCRNIRHMDLSFCIHHASRLKLGSIEAGVSPPSTGKKRPRADIQGDVKSLKPPLSGGRKPAKSRKISAVAESPHSSNGVRGDARGPAAQRRGSAATVGSSKSERRSVKTELEVPGASSEVMDREEADLGSAAAPDTEMADEAAEPVPERPACADASVQTEEEELLGPSSKLEADVPLADAPETDIAEVPMKRKIFWGAGDCWCWRVLLTLEEKGLEYESILLDLTKRELKEGEVAALNPRAQLPTLVDGDVVVCDSGAACQYLDWAYPRPRSASRPAGDKRLIPDDAAARSLVLQRMYESNCLEAAHRDAVACFSMAEEEDGQPRGEEWEEKKSRLKDELKLWESYLQRENAYLVGEELTLADTFFFPFLATSVRWGLDLQKAGFSALAEYHQRMAQREAVKKTWPAYWHNSEGTPALADVA